MNSLFQVLVARAAGRPPVGVPMVEPRPVARFEPVAASPSLDAWEETVEVTGETPSPSPPANLPSEPIETQSRQPTARATDRPLPKDRLREAREAAPPSRRPPSVSNAPPPSQPAAAPHDRSLEGTNPDTFGDRWPHIEAHPQPGDRQPTPPSVATPAQASTSLSEPARERVPGPSAAAVRREISPPLDSAPDLGLRPDAAALATRVLEREPGRETSGGEVGGPTAQALPSPAVTVPPSSAAQPVTVSIGRIEVSVAPPDTAPPPAAAPKRSRGFSGYERVRRGQR